MIATVEGVNEGIAASGAVGDFDPHANETPISAELTTT